MNKACLSIFYFDISEYYYYNIIIININKIMLFQYNRFNLGLAPDLTLNRQASASTNTLNLIFKH